MMCNKYSAGNTGIELAYFIMGSIENNIDAIQKELDEVVNATNTYKASDNDYTARLRLDGQGHAPAADHPWSRRYALHQF
jgi:hypothetical protein